MGSWLERKEYLENLRVTNILSVYEYESYEYKPKFGNHKTGKSFFF